jgi:4-hydroxybenzoate polyprenyltransferase/phosphoserine phosphatase
MQCLVSLSYTRAANPSKIFRCPKYQENNDNCIRQEAAMSTIPIVVDLDGTLIHTDMLHESVLAVLRDKPLYTLLIPGWLRHGKAVLKQRLAQHAALDVASLPYNNELIDWLKSQKEQGRKIVLCTASDLSIANAVAEHIGIFDEVMASDGDGNLAGKHKAEAVVRRFGEAGFDYAGNAKPDLHVWRRARRAIVVNAPERLIREAGALCPVDQLFPAPKADFRTWGRMMRVHQWLKNLLLFVPLVAAHKLIAADDWLNLVIAFFAFSLCASSVYIANDLLDLESDRQHPRKRNRPFASGRLPIWMGIAVGPVVWLGGMALALSVGMHFTAWLMFYFVLTCAYSWGLKRLVVVDCLTLAMLYTLRVVAGAAAAQMDLSFWLLAFAVFLFLSLAFVKRYAELEINILSNIQKLSGRGYYTSDAPLVQTLGVTAGYASVVVLALYINSDAAVMLYRMPEMVWGIVPVILFWISWMWMKAHRGEMHDDPLIFAIKDKASLAAGLVSLIILMIGVTGLPW